MIYNNNFDHHFGKDIIFNLNRGYNLNIGYIFNKQISPKISLSLCEICKQYILKNKLIQ